MEGSESAINRVSRAMWTVWGYLTGAVGRYLRPEVRNEEAQNVQQEDTVPISKSYKELKDKDEEKEKDETKMRDDLQYPGVRVRTAAVEWEKGNFAHCEDNPKSKLTCGGSEAGDKKSQGKKDNEKPLDDTSGSRETHSSHCTEQEDSPANIDADGKNQDRTFSGSEEADLNIERNGTSQEQTKKPEEEEKIMQSKFDKVDKEPIQSDQDLLAKEAELNETSKDYQEQGNEEEEKHVGESIKREDDGMEVEDKAVKSEFIVQGLLSKEAELNVERSESNQISTKKLEEEDVEIMRRANDETGEKELTKSESIEHFLMAKEADPNVERSKSCQERGRGGEEEEEEEHEDILMWRENDKSEEEPMKSQFTEEDLLVKEDYLHFKRDEHSQEQRRESQEEEEEGVDEILRRENEETEEEPIKSKFIEQGLMAKEADVNAERDENYQEQEGKQEEVMDDNDDEMMKSENDETENESVQREFIDLDVQRSECSQEQRREEEEEDVDEIMTRDNDESEEEPIQSEFIEQGLLAKEADLNVERDENYLEQAREEEVDEEEKDVDETRTRDSDESEEELIKSEFINQEVLNVQRSGYSQEQAGKEEEEGVDVILRRENEENEEGLLTKKADLNVGWSENNQAQIRKEEEEKEEGDVEIMKSENDETEEKDIRCEFLEQGILAKETDLNVKSVENYQVQGREEEENEEDEGVEEIMIGESDESEEEPIQSEFIDLDVQNVEKSECNQGQKREDEEEEESVDKILRREETEKDLVKCEFIEQGLLAKEADLNVEIDENGQEQERKQGKKREAGEIMKTENDETEEEPNQSVEMSKSTQEQRRKESLNDETEEEVSDQGFDPEEEPAGVCDPGATEEVHMASADMMMDYVYHQDKNELNVKEQICHVTMEHENKACKLQMVDEELFIQLTSTCEERNPLNPSFNLEVEKPDNATLLQEKEVIQVHNEETTQEAVGNEKDGYHEGFSACEKFTDTGIVEEQKVCDIEMKETLKQVIDRDVETEWEPLVVTQREKAKMYKKMFEPSSESDEEDNTIKMQQSEQSEEQKATSEMDLNVELRQLDDTVHDHKGSQRPAIMTKQDFEGVIIQPETETGNQTETVEATSKFRAEVAAVDVKKSAEREATSNEQHVDKEEVAAQKIMGQCFLEQESLLEDLVLVSAETKTNEAIFSEIKSIPFEETVVEPLDEMKGSSLQELDECSSEAELNLDTKSSSPLQTAECEISIENDECDKSVVSETRVETPINQEEFTEQEASSHGLSEIESEQKPLEIQTDSQKDPQELKRPDEADNGLVDEIKDVISCLGVEEDMSVLTKDLENSEREMEERKSHSEPESCEETSESSMNVGLLSGTQEREAEMTDVETMVDSTGEETKEMKEPIHQEEETDKSHLVPSESEGSKEIGQEHEEKVEHGQSVVDSKEDVGDGGRSGLKRGFEKITGDSDKDKPSVLTDLLLPSQASSLDFTVQKSKIAVKNPLIRPPKDPRTLINMASVEPLTPHPSQPSLPGFLKKSHIEGASLPSKGVIGFKLPGLGSGFSALRKTETGGKIRGREDSESVTSQKPESGSQSADDNVKQETSPQKPKWTPPRQPGMGNPMMMAELKSKLKKPAKE